MSRYGGSVHGDLRQTDLLRHILAVQQHMLQAILAVDQLRVDAGQLCNDRFFVLRVNALRKHVVSNGTINGTGIYI